MNTAHASVQTDVSSRSTIVAAPFATEDQSDATALEHFALPCRSASSDVVNFSIDVLATVKPRILVAHCLTTTCASTLFSRTQVRPLFFLLHMYKEEEDFAGRSVAREFIPVTT